MWIIKALIVHILLLGSIFVIYFRSPVITNLQPQRPLTDWGVEPPAKRLVLFVTDGLRAESFFHKNCSDIPNLRSLFQQQGLVGISHTRVPTESRPGHIALIAGLYEDPSAVTRGWKKNPIDFDTVFNRSRFTYAWGAHDVLHIFAHISDGGNRIFLEAYDHELDFSGHKKTYELDDWVFKRAKAFLLRKREELQEETKIVFFLHLLGLDTAGHIHKPGTELFLENLYRTETGIVDMYKQFEHIFPDERTAYILTSDHGMTNAGSHGAGDPLETETPFYLWGAGIANYIPNNRRFFNGGLDKPLPLYELEQAQLAPLMASLIGVAPPMNNFGILPRNYLNVTKEYEALAVRVNAMQLIAQFQSLYNEYQRGLFTSYLWQFPKLDNELIRSYLKSNELDIKTEKYGKAIESSYNVIIAALEGIDYYHSYYRNALLMTTSLTFLGWIYYMSMLLITPIRIIESRKPKPISLSLVIIGIVLIIFTLLQRLPWTVSFYLILPVLVWLLVLKYQRFSFYAHRRFPMKQLLVIILSAEFMVFSFFNRQLISGAFLVFGLVNNYRVFLKNDMTYYIWLFLIIILSIFPLLPPSVGYGNIYVLFIGIIITLFRPVITKTKTGRLTRIIATIGLGNALFCSYHHLYQLQIPLLCYALSWCFLLNSMIHIVFNTNKVQKQRLELIFFNLTCIYAMLCTSYEPLFVVLLASELMISLSAHEKQTPTQLDNWTSETGLNVQQLRNCLRLSFSILLYTFFSFFGTGNIASVSSFDPNIIKCFLSTFAPFVIMSLVILKLVLPVILNICIILGISSFARAHQQQIFICLLLICDIMGLNFLFLVRNYGSWLEIGTSISHFVIMEVTTLVLLLLTGISKILLQIEPISLTMKLN